MTLVRLCMCVWINLIRFQFWGIYQFVLRYWSPPCWQSEKKNVTCFLQAQLTLLRSTPSLPHPLRTSLSHSCVLIPFWPCLSLTLSFLPPIKPPSDLPTTFTFKPYPSRASAPLLLYAHSFFSIVCHPQLHSNLHYTFISPASNPHLLLGKLCPSELLMLTVYVSIHLNPWFLITHSILYLYVQRHITFLISTSYFIFFILTHLYYTY